MKTSAANDRSFETIVERLQSLWEDQGPVDLKSFVAEGNSLGAAELIALCRIDQSHRWRRGECVKVEQYLASFPVLAADSETIVDLLYAEFLLRKSLGEHPGLEEYRRRFPEHADVLAAQIEFHNAIADPESQIGGATVNLSALDSQATTNVAGRDASSNSTNSAFELAPPVELAAHPKYRLLRMLGIGGMGSVWLAEHALMNRTVAVKVIRPEFLATPGAAERFVREVQAAARLHHPNIVTAYDAEKTAGAYFFVMEYVAGETLLDIVKRGPLPPAAACRAARDAARGLAAAHAAGLIHRDIKPGNLIRNGDGVTKVLDFGLVGTNVEGEQGLTSVNAVMGTPDYIAPEQADDARSADARSDIYSLGCTLYHLLAGHVPYPGHSALKKLDAHRDPNRAVKLPPGISPKLAAVLTRMMAKKPADRFQTAASVADALEPFCHENEATSPQLSGTSARRSRGRLIAAGVLLALVGLATGAVIYKIQRDNEVITIETDDPDIDVMMRRNGEIVRIVDTKTKQAWEFDTNKLQLRPDGSDLTVDLQGREPLVIRRDGNAAVTIRRPQPPPFPEDVIVEPYRELVGHQGRVRNAIFSADSKIVYSCGDDGFIRIWNIQSGQETGRFDLKSGVLSVALADKGALLLAVQPINANQLRSRLSGWDLRTGQVAAPFPELPEGENLINAAVSPDGKRAATVSVEGKIRIWNIPDRKLEQTWTVDTQKPVYGIAWSPDGQQVSVGGDGLFAVWEVSSGKLVFQSPVPNDETSTVFLPDGIHVLAAGWDGLVRIYNRTTWKVDRVLQTRQTRSPAATHLALTPDGRLLLGAHTFQVRLWDIASDRRLAQLVGTGIESLGVSASPDGQLAVAGSEDGKVRVWQLPSAPTPRTP